MFHVKQFIAVLCLTLFAGNAMAADAQANSTISWQAPQFYVNGDPLDPNTEIDHYDVYIGETSRNYNLGSFEVAPDGRSSDVSVTLPGTYQDGDTISLYMAVTATVLNNPTANPAWDGSVSDYSNEVFKAFTVTLASAGGPTPPTNVSATFTIVCTAQAGVTCTITPIN